MFETHIEKINKLLVGSVEAASAKGTYYELPATRLRMAAQVEHYSRALAALYAAKQASTAEDALWCAEYTAALTASNRRDGVLLNATTIDYYAEQRILASKDANAAVELFRTTGRARRDRGKTQPPAQSLLRAIAQRVAEALGPEGRHASADCDVMADLELLISRGVQ